MNQEVTSLDGIFVAAHELKAPLALLRQLALSLDPSDPLDVATSREQLIAVSERTLRTVSDLSKVARLEDGLFAMEPVAVRSVVDEVSLELASLFREYDKSLDVRCSNRSRLVVANRDLLASILYNFCSNALKYSAAGSVSRLLVRDHQSRVRVSVRDFGPALPSRIYQAFNSSASLSEPVSIAPRPDSSGLGLFIASRFARFMHAQIGTVRHRDGVSFFIELPISHQASLF